MPILAAAAAPGAISWIRRRCRCVSIPRISARLSAPIIATSPRWPAGLPRLSPNTWATASSSATRRRMGTTRRARSRWAWRSSTRSAPSAYRIARDSDELDAHPTHTEHDHRRNEPGDNRAADHEPVGERLGDAVRHHDPTRADRKMGEDEECAEPIMRHEADVPLVLDESGWRARRGDRSGVDAKICPCEYEDRVHVAQHVKSEVDARRDLKGVEAVAGRCGKPPNEEEPRANLEEEERDHQRLQDVVAVHVPEHFHHRIVRPFACGEHQVVGDVERCYGAGGEDGNFVAYINRWSAAMPQPNDLSRSLVALDQDSTIIAVVELSQSSWLVGGILPGIERQPRKKLEPSPERLLALLHRWRDESVRAGRTITRIAVAFEAGRDGFWLARWLAARGVEAHVIHPSSVAVSREHRRAKTDRLDTELLKRGFLGWLRGERGHCSMARVPTIAEEDAKRPNRERECLVKERTRLVNRMKGTLARLGIRNFKPTLRQAAEHLAALSTPEGSALPPNVTAELERDIARLRLVIGQIKQLEEARRQRLEEQPERGPHAMVRLLARVVGIGIETADMLVNEVLSRPLRDRRAVARYAGLTGAPDESGAKRREQGLAKAGNARVRRGMIQLAWRFLRFQKNSALTQWYQARTADRRGATRKTLIVALARKLLIALWRFATTGQTLEGVVLRPAA